MADNTRKRIKLQLKNLLSLIKEYKWLVNSRIVDFMAKSLFDQLPSSWKNDFSKCNIEELSILLNYANKEPCNALFPLSLLSLRRLLQSFCLQRKQLSIVYSTISFKKSHSPESLLRQHERFRKLFTRHVKPKKRYEIEKMAEETAYLAKEANVTWIIDIGSGLGHLSRYLAYGYGLNVCAVEKEGTMSARATEIDEQLLRNASKFLPETDVDAMRLHEPHHREATIDFSTTGMDLLQLLETCPMGGEKEFGIIGLHPCGDLAAILLRIFVSCSKVKFINIVGCCYHKMTLSGENIGFPLSSLLVDHNGFFSMDSASHAIENYSNRLASKDYEHLKIHCFRATLERIILNRWPYLVGASLNNVRYPELTFPDYCDKALKKLNLKVPEEDLFSDETQQNLSRWKEVVFYFSLWTMMGPALESIVQLDRLLFVLENGIPCQLKTAFDPEISPRNLILSGVKEA